MSLIPPFVSKVDQIHHQDTVAPSLRTHCRCFVTTTGHSAPAERIGIRAHGVCRFPLPSNGRFSCSTTKPASRSCRLYTGCHSHSNQTPCELIPEMTTLVLTTVNSFRYVIDGSLSLISLIHT